MGIVARQATWNTLLTVVGMGLGFVNMALLYPKLLTPDEFGLTRLLVSIAVIVSYVAHLGGENTVIRYFPYFRDKAEGHRGLFGFILAVATAGGVVAMLAMAVFHRELASWFNDDSGLYLRYGLWVLPLLIAEVWLLVLRGFSRAVNRSVAPIFVREFLMRLLQTVLIGAYALGSMDFGLFLLLYVATFVITTAALFVNLWRAGELKLGLGQMRIGRRMRRSMGRYSLFTMGSGLAAIAVGNIDQVMVGALLPDGLSQVAFFAVALFMSSVVRVPSRALVQPVVPLLAEAWRARDTPKVQELYHRTAIIQLVASAFILLAIWINLDTLFVFLDPEYAVGKPILLVLAVANVAEQATGLSGGVVSTSRSYWFDAASGMVLLVLSVLLNFLFLRWMGVIGVAWSTLVSVVIVAGWRVWFLWKRFGLWPYDRGALKALGVLLLVGAVFSFLPHYGHPLVDLAWRSSLLLLVYGALVHLLAITPELGVQAGRVLRGRRTLSDDFTKWLR